MMLVHLNCVLGCRQTLRKLLICHFHKLMLPILKKIEAKVKNKTQAKPYIKKTLSVPIPSKTGIANFYSKISDNARDSVILRIIPEYSYKYMPLVAKLYTIIFNFYKREHEQ